MGRVFPEGATMKDTIRFLAVGFCLLFYIPAVIAKEKWEVAKKRRSFTFNTMDEQAMLKAIRQVESNEDPRAVGKKGERSAYQFMPATWALYSKRPFIEATTNPMEAERVAEKHLRTIATALNTFDGKQRAEWVGAAWNYGIRYAVILSDKDHPQRVANLYFEFLIRP